ncbi:MAG: adenylosuccinate lyase [Bacteroidia bacterium]|nr:adenylosuccinate lyase [Bacteroidia bacterium]
MTEAELYKQIKNCTALKKDRLRLMESVLDELKLFHPLLKLAFNVKHPDSHRAAWIVELLCLHDLMIIKDHLNYFSSHLNELTNDSAKRPMAKICSLILHPKKGLKLTQLNKEKMTSTCFDWMIDDSAVAVKVYAITSLYELGKEKDWIHDELRIILEKNYTSSSAGYQCRAREILKKN